MSNINVEEITMDDIIAYGKYLHEKQNVDKAALKAIDKVIKMGKKEDKAKFKKAEKIINTLTGNRKSFTAFEWIGITLVIAWAARWVVVTIKN